MITPCQIRRRARKASRETQELDIRKNFGILAGVEDRRHLFPAVADQLIDFFRIGARPTLSEQNEHEQRRRRYPHGDSKTVEIITSIFECAPEERESLRPVYLPFRPMKG